MGNDRELIFLRGRNKAKGVRSAWGYLTQNNKIYMLDNLAKTKIMKQMKT